MKQKPIYKAILESGYKVVGFADYPQYSGSWYAIVQKNKRLLRLCYDGKNTRLAIQEKGDNAQWKEIKQQGITELDTAQEISLCKKWLLEERGITP